MNSRAEAIGVVAISPRSTYLRTENKLEYPGWPSLVWHINTTTQPPRLFSNVILKPLNFQPGLSSDFLLPFMWSNPIHWASPCLEGCLLWKLNATKLLVTIK